MVENILFRGTELESLTNAGNWIETHYNTTVTQSGFTVGNYLFVFAWASTSLTALSGLEFVFATTTGGDTQANVKTVSIFKITNSTISFKGTDWFNACEVSS